MTHRSLVGEDTSGGTRSQSSVLGIVLLFGIVIAGSSLIVSTGATALSDS